MRTLIYRYSYPNWERTYNVTFTNRARKHQRKIEKCSVWSIPQRLQKKSQKLYASGEMISLSHRLEKLWRERCEFAGIVYCEERIDILDGWPLPTIYNEKVSLERFPDTMKEVVEWEEMYNNPAANEEDKRDILGKIKYIMDKALLPFKLENDGFEEVDHMIQNADQEDEERKQLVDQASKEAQQVADRNVFKAKLAEMRQRD